MDALVEGIVQVTMQNAIIVFWYGRAVPFCFVSSFDTVNKPIAVSLFSRYLWSFVRRHVLHGYIELNGIIPSYYHSK